MLLEHLINEGFGKPYKILKGHSVKIKGKTFVQSQYDRKDEQLVLMDAKLLERLWKLGGESWIIGPGPEYKNQIKNRIAQFKEWFSKNDNVEVATVHVNENGAMGFGNGRHRTRVLIELGMKSIPLSMSQEALDNLKQIA